MPPTLPSLLLVLLLGAHLFYDGVRSGGFVHIYSRRANTIVYPRALQRKLLQEQQSPVWTHAADGNAQKKAHSIPEVKQEHEAENANNREPKVAAGNGDANEKKWVPNGREKGRKVVENEKKWSPNAEYEKWESKEVAESKLKAGGGEQSSEVKKGNENEWKPTVDDEKKLGPNVEGNETWEPRAEDKKEWMSKLKAQEKGKLQQGTTTANQVGEHDMVERWQPYEQWKEAENSKGVSQVGEKRTELKEPVMDEQTKHEAKTEEPWKGFTVAVEKSKSEGKDGAKPDDEKQEKQLEKKVEHKKANEGNEVKEQKQDSKLREKKDLQKTQGKQDVEKGDHIKELNIKRKKVSQVKEEKEEPKVKVQNEEARTVEEKTQLPENEEDKEKDKTIARLTGEESKEGLQVDGIRHGGLEGQAKEEESKPNLKEELNFEKDKIKVDGKKQEPNMNTKTIETKVEAMKSLRGFEEGGEPLNAKDVEWPQSKPTKRASWSIEETKGEQAPSGKNTKEKWESQLQNEKQTQDDRNDTAKSVPTQELREAKRRTATKIVDDLNVYFADTTDLDSDQDYPDFLEELRNFPERFQKTAESVKDHIKYSGLDRYSTHSKELFNQANHQIQESFTPLIGKDYAPFVAYMVSYGFLLLPLVLVAYFLERVRAIFSLQKILLLVNMYLSAYFAALMAATLVLDSEPMDLFMKYSTSSYIFLQLLQAFGYLVYLLLSTVDLVSTCSTGRIAAKISSALQCLVVIAVGFHYYVTVFHRAMERKPPITGWKIYGLYSISFCFLRLFARVERGKKQYIPVEQDDTTDKKN